MLLFSIVIAVYNDWAPLDACLRSIVPLKDNSRLEVIVVDDGSDDPAPSWIRQYVSHLPLTIIRQSHRGISIARNCGVQRSQGSIVLFSDADCRFEENSLWALEVAIASSPQHDFFQLRLTGDCSRLTGRAETLRLTTLQDHLMRPNGCIRYLNTAGFAIRRSSVLIDGGLFDPAAFRGEDTLLLANLIERRELPFFVSGATIRHDIALSLLRCLRKDIRSAFLERKTYFLIAKKGINIHMSNAERLSLLRSMWKASAERSIGRSAWFVLAIRQSLKRITSVAASFLCNWYDSQTTDFSIGKHRLT